MDQSPKMRAKMVVETVEVYRTTQGVTSEKVKFRAVAKKGSYPSDGSDEDNTYAKFSPSANLEILIANPALFGQLNPGEFYYVDFTQANRAD
jgi:hypothetical protein